MIYLCLIDFVSFILSLHAYYVCTPEMTFDACFLIQIYRCTCAYPCTSLDTHLATR